MKKIFTIVSVLILCACSTPKTVLKNDQGQVAVCGGELPHGMIEYYLQKQVNKECVEIYKKYNFKVVEAEQ